MGMNAADRDQVRLSKRHDRNRQQQQFADLRAVLRTAEGRRVLQWLIDELQPAVQYWQSNAAAVGYHATRHDVGTWLKQHIAEADPDALVRMLVEAREQEKQEMRERQAQQTNRRKPDNVNESGEE